VLTLCELRTSSKRASGRTRVDERAHVQGELDKLIASVLEDLESMPSAEQRRKSLLQGLPQVILDIRSDPAEKNGLPPIPVKPVDSVFLVHATIQASFSLHSALSQVFFGGGGDIHRPHCHTDGLRGLRHPYESTAGKQC